MSVLEIFTNYADFEQNLLTSIISLISEKFETI